MRRIVLSLIFNILLPTIIVLAQQPVTQWQKAFGGSSFDQAQSVITTVDGGYISAGLTASANGDVTSNHGSADVWIVKIDSAGTLQWQKNYGGTNDDAAFSIIQTSDSGFAVAASSSSSNGDLTTNHGFADWWIFKIDSSGTLQWKKTFGGSFDDVPYDIVQTIDGGFAVCGYTASADGDINTNHGFEDFWIAKLSAAGTLVWQKTFGGTLDERAYAIRQSADGNYFTGGYTKSTDGDVTGNHGDYDFWMLKLDSSGTLLWKKTLGGSSIDKGYSFLQTSDDRFLASGFTASSDGDVTLNHGFEDLWLVKLDTSGNIQWQKTFGGTGVDQAYVVREIPGNNGYVAAGSSFSTDGDVTGNHGGYDYWIMKADTAGNLVWQQSLGGSSVEECYGLTVENSNAYVLAGSTLSADGDVTGNHGDMDYWLVKLHEAPTAVGVIRNSTHELQVSPNPFAGSATIQFDLDLPSFISLEVYDPEGQKIITLCNGMQNKGHHLFTFDPATSGLPAGIYTARLIQDHHVSHVNLVNCGNF